MIDLDKKTNLLKPNKLHRTNISENQAGFTFVSASALDLYGFTLAAQRLICVKLIFKTHAESKTKHALLTFAKKNWKGSLSPAVLFAARSAAVHAAAGRMHVGCTVCAV